jgi:arginyl-tRNA synthetase
MQQIYPDYLNSTPNVNDLSTFYKEAKKKFDSDPEFKKAA